MSDGLFDQGASYQGGLSGPGQPVDGEKTGSEFRSGKRKRRRARKRKSDSHPPAPAMVQNAANEAICSGDDGQSSAKRVERAFRRHAKPPSHANGSADATNGALPAQKTETHAAKTRNKPHPRHNGGNPHKRSGNGIYRSNPSQRYAALDLGTNNCRLLVAEPREQGFRVVDAFSRIVRLGDGMAASGALGDAAMTRAIDALKICSRKLADNNVRKARLIATEACRYAENGVDFLARVEDATGLKLEIVDRQTEARLAVAGCSSLVHPAANGVILFDIGGGSSELVWLDLRQRRHERGVALARFIRAWTSLPVGVVTLSERFGGVHVTPEIFDQMVDHVDDLMSQSFDFDLLDREFERKQIHLLGTSGTVTTLAGIHLNLERYDRRRVDGLWMSNHDVSLMIDRLVAMNYAERVGNPCIGSDRADLVLAGCAIFEAVRRRWPCKRIRVADRGLREGILMEMMSRDRVWKRHRDHRPSHHSSPSASNSAGTK